MLRVRFMGRKSQGAIRFGSNTLVNGDLITIGNKVFEFRTSGSSTPPNVQVNVAGSAALTAAALITAINANKPTNGNVGIAAVVDPVDTAVVRLIADKAGALGNVALTEAVADAGIIVSGANLTGGKNAGVKTMGTGRYVVTALDVLATNVVIETSLPAATPSEVVLLYVRSSTGLFKGTLTGLITQNGTQIRHDFAGATDLVAGDTIDWACF